MINRFKNIYSRVNEFKRRNSVGFEVTKDFPAFSDQSADSGKGGQVEIKVLIQCLLLKNVIS